MRIGTEGVTGRRCPETCVVEADEVRSVDEDGVRGLDVVDGVDGADGLEDLDTGGLTDVVPSARWQATEQSPVARQ